MYCVNLYGLHVYCALVDLDSFGPPGVRPTPGLTSSTQVVCVCVRAYTSTHTLTSLTPAKIEKHCTGFAWLVWGRLRAHQAFVYSDWLVCYVCFCSLRPPLALLLSFFGHPAMPPPPSRVSPQSCRLHEFLWDLCYLRRCAPSKDHLRYLLLYSWWFKYS